MLRLFLFYLLLVGSVFATTKEVHTDDLFTYVVYIKCDDKIPPPCYGGGRWTYTERIFDGDVDEFINKLKEEGRFIKSYKGNLK